ncbi:Trypsin domain containing protein [Asbolus verrucosus]|uniref:Trypsin domain containing protein n=1 Tax=Asbolus verrucosus TaxID=1661398 RepID=A0A482VEC1_ASBVE|nr:Trypsin domain containing protein [Asbolus verrucosus]
MFTVLVTSNSILSTAITISSDEKCVRLEDCPQLDNLIRTKRNHFGTRNLLRLLDNYCADKNREVFVKCVSPSKIVEYMEKSELLPSYENCGTDNLHEKISGGETADLGEYSWIGLLKYRNIVGGINYGCHANLISKKYLLTAAHCVDRSTTSFKMKLLGNVWEFCADEAKEYLIESYTVHPDYDRSSRINDIALIRLNEEVKFSVLKDIRFYSFSGFIKPICLPPNSLRLNYGETWWITGWGETADCE